MITKLTLHEAGRTMTNGVIGSAAGEEARIAEFNHSWRILRWNETSHGNCKGRYASAEAALAALHDEISLMTVS